MTVVVGVDPSVNATGLAVWRDGKVVVHTLKSDSKEILPVRWEQIATGVSDAIPKLPGEQVLFVIEQPPAKFVGPAAAIPNHGLYAILIHRMWWSQSTYVDVQPTQLKKFATGKGGGPSSSKEGVMLAIERRYGHLVKISNNNEADAFALMAMGLHHYGHPLADVPIDHTERLQHISWPQWNGFHDNP